MEIPFLRFFRRSPAEAPSSAEILKELLAELKDLGRSAKHINALRTDVGKFVARFPRLDAVTRRERRMAGNPEAAYAYRGSLGERRPL